jgi:hypothetical protein
MLEWDYCAARCGRYTGYRTICDDCRALLPVELEARLFLAAAGTPDAPAQNPLEGRAAWNDEFEDWFNRAVRYLTRRS